MRTTIIKKTLRVPASDGARGDGGTTARQLDAALIKVGFKASRELIEHISDVADAEEYAQEIVRAVKELVGARAQHNPYFKDFPHNVPDTVAFWLSCISDVAEFSGNLLDLPKYGRVQHTYEEMLKAHDELIPSLKDRMTVLHLGGTLDDEITRLYLELAESPIPLGEDDRTLLGELATQRLDVTPEAVPTRENRAILNAARLVAQRPLADIDTVTDVLRLAAEASGGDVTLRESTRFRSFRRPERRALLAALDEVEPSKFGDVNQHREAWKRLGERLHPHEHPFAGAQDVFAVARKEKVARSFAGQVEMAFADNDPDLALRILAKAPGMLLRSVDRLVRSGASNVAEAVATAAPDVSGRVLVSVLEHLGNRSKPDTARVFANRSRKVWIADDSRPPIDATAIVEVIEAELVRRLPEYSELTVDPEVLDVVVPMSGTATEDGFGVLPRGSKMWLEGDVLRFFVHWHQMSKRTDFDLSVVLLDENFAFRGQVSWTQLKDKGAFHSGDLTDATNGATEFIDLHRDAVEAKYIVPQVNVYSGEGFDQVAESTFGFMTRDLDQLGKPFEPSTVRARSSMRGKGKVALPIMFERQGDLWFGTWLHLYLRGNVWGNRVEENRDLVKLITAAALHRKYFTVRKLVELFERKGSTAGARTIHIGPVAELANLLSD
ncbi:TerD family protein [Lentzea aerocolonigenes]|uniref:TerD family protein n=1 Tax=Lentzea aerocolonigenes TaxID=68170 RepID=UPI000698F190|nr:TerD family protein [Lentzea aerocolonigenes]